MSQPALHSLPGQPRAREILEGGISRGQVHHAYLFGGPEGAGKEQAARLFLQALNCEHAKAGQAGCGSCGECHRIASFNHPDIHWVMPESELVTRKLLGRAEVAGTPSRQIKIDQVRKVMDRLALRPLTARRKAAVLLGAETLNVPAQNALLKTLEEPPEDTTFVLCTASPDSLLPTIRSRCLRVPFAPLPVAQVTQLVASAIKVPQPQAERMARLAQGSLRRALELDADRLSLREPLFKAVLELKRDDARPALALAEAWGKDRDEAEWALEMLQLFLRDLLSHTSGTPLADLANGDLTAIFQRALSGWSPATSPAHALAQLEAITSASAALARNGGARFALERLFLCHFP